MYDVICNPRLLRESICESLLSYHGCRDNVKLRKIRCVSLVWHDFFYCKFYASARTHTTISIIALVVIAIDDFFMRSFETCHHVERSGTQKWKTRVLVATPKREKSPI